MIKNVIIIILIYLCATLVYESRSNVDILLNDMEQKAKAMGRGADYIKEQFDDSNVTNMTKELLELEPKEFDTKTEEIPDEPLSK
tara:strand:+ start:2048 stop:2302 length:255 start_codon:yes stop_codon:yes gene_type:complete